MELFIDILKDTTIDTVKLIPFLFLTYLAMEYLENKAGQTVRMLLVAGKKGPVIGGILGVVPQCGFSAAAANLYSGGVITVGTMIAVFLSTSDEMLPIFLSEKVPMETIFKILAVKVVIAVISGFAVEFAYLHLIHHKEKDLDIHTVCEEEHCSCEDGVLQSAMKHTIKIFFFIFLISAALNLLIGFVGEESIAAVFQSTPVVGEAVAALVGLIPNCASSVVITQLYLQHIISAGALMSGLLVNAGVGLLILFRLNRQWKKNLCIVGMLYVLGVFWGIVIEMSGILF